jgi:hypothetical protein
MFTCEKIINHSPSNLLMALYNTKKKIQTSDLVSEALPGPHTLHSRAFPHRFLHSASFPGACWLTLISLRPKSISESLWINHSPKGSPGNPSTSTELELLSITQPHLGMQMGVHTCTHRDTHAHTCMCTHTHIRVRTHTHTHIWRSQMIRAPICMKQGIRRYRELVAQPPLGSEHLPVQTELCFMSSYPGYVTRLKKHLKTLL